MQNEQNMSWMSTAGKRTVLVSSLIALVSLFWVILLVNANLSVAAMAAIAVVSVLLLSTAVAWAASALPRRNAGSHS
ncbi:hypothetical protein HFP89_15455 [Wenzhouxiangella sp. XN79A]|uniref:hypothetical protein n=1 Tax=Wenzhouxiangella sp. XN79A TaxID=2724193 RepID=UPI00144A59F9|nr:hypothetical protein [Wenzhouxiangella sp. XN79A]NKI36567.1 hypothetical protein [Wenzhouxiangella sp. XN79A]